ncbi:unnamed protein product [marine sediment metagenome]|uniref:Uncharacterized protein n=1 Tax=marine sediment metagenome TaxID=412755 RepID=X0S592_9ZZZZ
MRYVWLALILTGCTTQYDKNHSGCEYSSAFAIYTYVHCGEKGVDVETRRKLRKDL